MNEGEENVREIAARLQAALTEVIACLPGKPRTVSVGACEYTADDVRGFLRRMKKAEWAVRETRFFFGEMKRDGENTERFRKYSDVVAEIVKGDWE